MPQRKPKFSDREPQPRTPPTIRAATLSERIEGLLQSVLDPFVNSLPGQALGVVGQIMDEGFRGNMVDDPRWKAGATVWHGSPYRGIKKFDSSKIGTGEGAQVRGHGLYMADEQAVAKTYKPQGGALYKVDLPDEQIAKMLDWDAPLSQQAPGVQQAIQRAGYWPTKPNEVFGRDIAINAGDRALDVDRAWVLRKHGIPGIKYYDSASRQGGQGTRNFVVFDDALPKIVGER